MCFASSCKTLNSASLAANSAAASALFMSMTDGAFEDRLVRDRLDLLDALLDLLRTDLISSSLRDAAELASDGFSFQ